MKTRLGTLALALLLSTCAADQRTGTPGASVEESRAALGTIPASEIALWRRVAGIDAPDPRVGQAVAYDSTRKLVVLFGGTAALSGDRPTLRGDIWQWNSAAGVWRDEDSDVTIKPDARSEAAMVYDSARDRFIVFGGRAGGGLNFEDTWEWNPTDGVWTNKTGSGAKPDARARHAMVYDAKRKVVVLFGGGRSIQGTAATTSTDLAAITTGFASTWEYEPVIATWTDRTPASAAASPSPRYDAGLVWDSGRGRVVLFGGMQKTNASSAAVAKQDTWEWNGDTGTWTERTAAGTNPSARFGHGMAYDPGRSKVVLFGGAGDSAGATKNDLWDLDPVTGTWTERPAPATLPSARVWASLVLTDSSPARIELVAGSTTATSMGGAGASVDINDVPVPALLNEVWDLDPAAGSWKDRPAGTAGGPAPRSRHTMATDLDTGKVYMFGGEDEALAPMNDLWVWDGYTWAECKTTGAAPSKRADAGMTYDPARKSLILFGGTRHDESVFTGLADTWEWNIARAMWTELKVAGSPPGRSWATMVTDVKRKRIVMAGGMDYSRKAPLQVNITDVWEWDGSASTWTNVSPPVGWGGPQYPFGAWDVARSKLVALEGETGPEYFEWDPDSHAWAPSAIADKIVPGSMPTFDSNRRRMVTLGKSFAADPTGATNFALELDTTTKQWFARPLPAALAQHQMSVLAYDNKRSVVVLFGGHGTTSGVRGDTWEYRVSGSGNGTGCRSDLASQCASGNCVDGVCCDSAACTGPCQSCNVPWHLGTCVTVPAGTEVAGSCSDGKACDGVGGCKPTNGSPCSAKTDCASGYCADGVCCDGACKDTCESCNIPGLVGKCAPYQAGSDPEQECSKGAPPCQSSCDGLGACEFPTSFCGQCGQCNGSGTCVENYYYPTCPAMGGAGGSGGAGGAGGTGGASGAGGTGGFAGSGGRGGSSGSGGLATEDASADTGGKGAGGVVGPADSGSGGTAGTVADGGGVQPGTGGRGATEDGGLFPFDGGGLIRDGAGTSADAKASDGPRADATIVVTLQRGSCSCDLGNRGSRSPAVSMLLLAAVAWLARRQVKRHR